jgi:hypothetical protein
MQWVVRMGVILAAVATIDVLVVVFASRPMPWAALVPSLIPVLTVLYVIAPMLKTARP